MKRLAIILVIATLVVLALSIPAFAANKGGNSVASEVSGEVMSFIEQVQAELNNNNMPAVVKLILSVVLLPVLIVAGVFAAVGFLIYLAFKFTGIWIFFI